MSCVIGSDNKCWVYILNIFLIDRRKKEGKPKNILEIADMHMIIIPVHILSNNLPLSEKVKNAITVPIRKIKPTSVMDIASIIIMVLPSIF